MVTTINGSNDSDDDISLTGDSAYASNGFGGGDTITASGAFGSATVFSGDGADSVSMNGAGTITLEGIGDGTIDDMQDLMDRDYHILFDAVPV